MKAYSYVRFSTPEQALGDSERRQIAQARDFAKRKGWVLDESLRPDRGLSGYHGLHRKKGVLGEFLKAVRGGQIERGSILIVENADRLSREGVEKTLRKIIFELWDFDITLQTLSPEETYEPGCGDGVKFLALLLYLTRAHEESERKSRLVREAREAARKAARTNGDILTARCPAWLTVEDGKFVTIKAAVKTIRKIFKWYGDGVSVREIERKLNERCEWERENGWRHSYIRKILSNRAVIGEYQPFTRTDDKRVPIGDPIPDYYPQIVDDALFHRVQERLSVNRGRGGQTGKASNLFKGIVFCPYCGGKMHFIYKGKGPKGRMYLECDSGRRGVGCAKRRIQYDEVEKTVLANCKGLNAQTVLPNPDEQSKLCESLRQRISGNIAKTNDIQHRIDNLIDQVSRTGSATIRDGYERKIVALEDQRNEIEATIAEDQAELARAEQTVQSFERWQADLDTLTKALGNKEDVELRMKVQSHLRQLIEKIEIWTDGYAELFDWANSTEPSKIETRYETIEAEMYNVMDEPDPGFINYVVKERMSRRGRFVRVFFVSGVWVDLVPAGSIASGCKLYVDESGKRQWGFVLPDFDRLREEYSKV